MQQVVTGRETATTVQKPVTILKHFSLMKFMRLSCACRVCCQLYMIISLLYRKRMDQSTV
jgi:hypothetical protein